MTIAGQDGAGTPGGSAYSNTIGANVANGGMAPFAKNSLGSVTSFVDGSGNVIRIYPDGRFVNDGVALYDATSTASATSAITSATAAFTSADVGKVCVILPYSDSGLTPRWGTITAVASATSVTTSLSASPGALTSATFIYGTDNGAAIDAALTAAAALPYKGVVMLPLGITMSTLLHSVPSGVTLQGVSNNPTGGKAKDFKHYGSSLVLAKAQTGAFVTLGSFGSTDPRGSSLRNLNVDCMNLSTQCVSGDGGRTSHVFYCTLVRGQQETYKGGPTSRLMFNMFMGQNAYNVVQLSGDSTMLYNNVTGAGNGYYGVKTSNGDDVQIAHNHIWKDSSASTMLGGSIFISHNSGNLITGSVAAIANKCDTHYGPGIFVSISGTSTARGIQICDNTLFNNDSVTNNTGPVISISVAAGSIIRGLVIQGNNARGSWNDPTKGQWASFIDGSAIAGNVYGSVVGGNVADNCNALFATFTPDHDNGNIAIAGTGTTLTKSTTT